jgi:hypothetical protein
MQQEPTTTTTLTETVYRSNDIGPHPPVRPLPTVRPATHTTSDLPRIMVTDGQTIHRAVQRWRDPKYLTYSTFTARARSYFKWPQQPQKPSPDDLSKAGFFYSGKCIFFLLLYFTPDTQISFFRSLIVFSFASGYRYRWQNDLFSLWGFTGWLGLRRPPFLWARGMVPLLRERQLHYEPGFRQKLSADELITWEAAGILVHMLNNILYTELYRRSLTNLIPVVPQQLVGAPQKADVLAGSLLHSTNSPTLKATVPRPTRVGRSCMLFHLLNTNKKYYCTFSLCLHSNAISITCYTVRNGNSLTTVAIESPRRRKQCG